MLLGVRVNVCEGVTVAVGLSVDVSVGRGVWVREGVQVGIGVFVGERVRVGGGVFVDVGVAESAAMNAFICAVRAAAVANLLRSIVGVDDGSVAVGDGVREVVGVLV